MVVKNPPRFLFFFGVLFLTQIIEERQVEFVAIIELHLRFQLRFIGLPLYQNGIHGSITIAD